MTRTSTRPTGRPSAPRRGAALGGIALTAALAASMLATAPAMAATDLHGVVLDQGKPVSDVDVALYQWDTTDNEWDHYDDTTTDSSGAWTITDSIDNGDYALFYQPETDASAPFSTAQGWNGALDNDALTKQFSVRNGAASQSAFTQTLRRNAGALKVHVVDASTNAPITGDLTGGYGQVYFGDGYTADDGYVDQGVNIYKSNQNFDGLLATTHVLAATYFYGYAYVGTSSTGYNGEQLDPVRITAGATTEITVRLYPNGYPYVSTVLPNNYRPKISGTPKVGSLLTVSTVTTAARLSYQWYSGDAPILGATAQTFVPTTKELGQPLSVQVIARQTGYSSDSWGSNDTKPVKIGDPNGVSVSISGTAKFGHTLTASVKNPLSGTKEFRWYRDGAPVAGADGSSYVLTKADVAHRVFVSVKSTVQGHSDSVTPSAAVTVAKDAAKVTVTTKSKITTASKPKVAIKLSAGASKLSASGSVRVYYTSKKFKTVKISSGKSKSVTLPKLGKGTKTIKVVYAGNGSYSAKTVTKKVKVSKK